MKVVINRCYGGFGLSRTALVALTATDCTHVGRFEPSKYYGGSQFGDWKAKFAEDMKRPVEGVFCRPLLIDEKIITDEHRHDPESRSCPHLVAVVEALGEGKEGRASGDLAELEVVEVPDGVSFEVDEYDGVESIHETHRRWP